MATPAWNGYNPRVNVCPTCGRRAEGAICPADASALASGRVVEAFTGRMLGNYQVERLLAAGGMGAVFLARHAKIGTFAVVKVLSAELSRDPAERRRFENEARLASQILHPNVVRIFDCGEVAPDPAAPEERYVYLIMELIEGEDAAAVLAREGRLEPLRAARILRQVASALDAAHTSPAGTIVHRDLKPGNIRLTRRGREEHAVVLDFGIAKAIERPAGEQLTIAGMIIGTPHYMSPEQASGDPIDGRSDLYSLGVVGYALLVGKLPFDGETLSQVLRKQLFEPPPAFPEALRLPKPLTDVILRCLEKEPAKRYQSAAALVEALDRAIAAMSPPSGGRRLALAGAGVLAAASLAVAVWAIFFHKPAGPPHARLGALEVAGRRFAPGEPIYVREAEVDLEGEVAGPSGGRVAVLPDGPSAQLSGGRFRLRLADLPAEGARELRIALDGAPLATVTVVRDRRPPRLALRAIASDGVVPDPASKTAYVRLPRVFLPLEVADESPLGDAALAVTAAPPLAAVAGTGPEGRGADLDCRAMQPGASARLTCRATDLAGNTTEEDLTIVYDPTPPVVRVTDVSPDGDRLRVRVEASDAFRVDSLLLSGEGPQGAIAPRPPLLREGARATFDVPIEAEGEYRLRVVARDPAGNQGEAQASFTRAIPLEAPLTVLARGAPLAPAADGTYYTSSAALAIRIAPNKPLRAVRVDGAPGPAPADPKSAWEIALAIDPKSAAATHEVVIEPATGAPVERRLKVVHDEEPPAIAILSPDPWPAAINAAAAKGGALPLTVAVTDANPPAAIDIAPLGPVPLRDGRAEVAIPLVHGAPLALTITAIDAAGNVATLARSAPVDLRPPEIVAVPTQPRFKVHETAAIRIKTDEPCRALTVDGSTAGLRAEGPRDWIFETPMYLDTPLRRRIEAVDEAGNRAAVDVVLAREAVCATTGEPLTDAEVKVLLDDPRALPGCPHCDKLAVSPERKKRP
jgi:hypothetical protein